MKIIRKTEKDGRRKDDVERYYILDGRKSAMPRCLSWWASGFFSYSWEERGAEAGSRVGKEVEDDARHIANNMSRRFAFQMTWKARKESKKS